MNITMNTNGKSENYFPVFDGLGVADAEERLRKIVNRTPLTLNRNLSAKYQCNIFLKREALQVVRSYKLRGAYNMLSTLPAEKLKQGVGCASAGDPAQGFGYSCKKLVGHGVVLMPVNAPAEEVQQTKAIGEKVVE